MSTTKSILIESLIAAIVAALVGIIIGFVILTHTQTPQAFGDAGQPNYIANATSTTITCGTTTSTQVLVSSAGSRQYALFTLDSATTTDLCFNRTCTTATASTNFGTRGQSYSLAMGNLYPGAVSCITPAGTSTLDVFYQQ